MPGSGHAHGGDRRIASSGSTISGAALIMVAVFALFALTGVPVITELGFGAAVAIAIDATIVRLMLVPAAMVLLGDRCWWSPTIGGSRARETRSRWGRADSQHCWLTPLDSKRWLQ